MPMGIDLNTKLETQIRIVQSDTIANSVMKQLALQRNTIVRREARRSIRQRTSTI